MQKEKEGLTSSQIRQITKVASEIAIEQYQQARQKYVAELKDKRYQNTKLLFEKYRGFVAHSESAIYESIQLNEDLELQEILSLMTGEDNLTVHSIRQSAARTRIIVDHIDTMLLFYKTYCEQSKKEEMMRRYETVYYLYISDVPKSCQELADMFCVDVSTVYRYNRSALNELGALLFGSL